MDLIKNMICPEDYRYTAQEVLQHKWCKKVIKKTNKKLKIDYTQMKMWRNFEKFKNFLKLKKTFFSKFIYFICEEKLKFSVPNPVNYCR